MFLYKIRLWLKISFSLLRSTFFLTNTTHLLMRKGKTHWQITIGYKRGFIGRDKVSNEWRNQESSKVTKPAPPAVSPLETALVLLPPQTRWTLFHILSHFPFLEPFFFVSLDAQMKHRSWGVVLTAESWILWLKRLNFYWKCITFDCCFFIFLFFSWEIIGWLCVLVRFEVQR